MCSGLPSGHSAHTHVCILSVCEVITYKNIYTHSTNIKCKKQGLTRYRATSCREVHSHMCSDLTFLTHLLPTVKQTVANDVGATEIAHLEYRRPERSSRPVPPHSHSTRHQKRTVPLLEEKRQHERLSLTQGLSAITRPTLVCPRRLLWSR